MKRVQVGDKVTTVFDGEVIAIDNELGKITLRGNTRGAQHIDWEVDVHWATEFYEGRPTVGPDEIANYAFDRLDRLVRSNEEAAARAKAGLGRPPGFLRSAHPWVGR